MQNYNKSILIPATPENIFAYIDDHARFSAHMSKSSWMMGGESMDVTADEGRGQEVGSHIRLKGKIFGISLYLDEVVTQHDPPHLKTWETVGIPKLLVIGNYRMKILIEPKETGALFSVSIDYDLPTTNIWLGKLFGKIYAKWCVEQMITGTRKYFNA